MKPEKESVLSLLYGFSKAICTVWNHQCGSARNHSVLIIKEMLLQKDNDKNQWW